MSDFLWPCGLQPARFLCSWNSPGKNSGGVAISSSRGSSQMRGQTQVWSCIASRFLTIWATREAHGKVLERALKRQWGPCSQLPGASSKVERVLYLHSLGAGNSEGRAGGTWSCTLTLAQGHCEPQTGVWCWPGCCLVSSWGSWSLYHTLWDMVAISTQNPVQLKWKTPSWPCTKSPRLLGKKQNKRNQKKWPLCQPWKIPSQWTKCLLRQNVNIPQGNLETVCRAESKTQIHQHY